jgi:large conductance mechanosensitive channel
LPAQRNISNLFAVLKQGVPSPPYPTIDAAQKAGAVTLNYCAFINTCIIFLIIAFSDFLLIRMINKLREQEAPATPEEIVLLRDIRNSLKE